MQAGARVLVASRAPKLVSSLVQQLSNSAGHFQFVGAIDPDLGAALTSWPRDTDILLIDEESFLRIWRRSESSAPPWLRQFRTLILADSTQMIELVSRTQRQFHLIVLPSHNRLASLIHLSLDGYVALAPELVDRLQFNRDRLTTVTEMPDEERRVLAYLGDAWSAHQIERATGFTSSRVKSITQTILQKLYFPNRTAVAVFATTHDLGVGVSPSSLWL